jgi:GxxExxY protein
MTENEISKIILDKAFEIHKELGPGLLESVYEELLCYKFEQADLFYERQKAIPVIYEDIKMEIGFRADIIVENKVIIENKSVDNLADVHYKQLLTYLRLTDLQLGLLINFNEALLKDCIKRIVNNLEE